MERLLFKDNGKLLHFFVDFPLKKQYSTAINDVSEGTIRERSHASD